MTEKELDLFARAWLFLGNTTCYNHGAEPINPTVIRVDTGEEVTPREKVT